MFTVSVKFVVFMGSNLCRNEILVQLQESSSVLTQYDPGHDFLAMYEALWTDTKARLARPVLSEADIACDIRCITHLLRVHHRLLLDDEEKEHSRLIRAEVPTRPAMDSGSASAPAL